MRAEYKGATFEGTPDEVTKAIELMDKPKWTVTYVYPQEGYTKIPNAMDAMTTISATASAHPNIAGGMPKVWFVADAHKPGIGG